ncbi:TraR/DksA C4-type zinc finger protein [Enterobacter cloacae]|uniref:TraR/DksA C4-type zinc finger protein n=1 Tax=Enterobacter cloacae TaxID=550 RepID=UPI0032AFBDB3
MQRHIQNARTRKPALLAFLCIDCDAPIPTARKQAIPGVQCCVMCQENHYTKRAGVAGIRARAGDIHCIN